MDVVCGPVNYCGNFLCVMLCRQEKTTWEEQNGSIKEQYLVLIAEKEQQLSHLQQVVQEMRLPLSKAPAVEEQYQKKVGRSAQILYCMEMQPNEGLLVVFGFWRSNITWTGVGIAVCPPRPVPTAQLEAFRKLCPNLMYSPLRS